MFFVFGGNFDLSFFILELIRIICCCGFICGFSELGGGEIFELEILGSGIVVIFREVGL